MVRVAVSGLAGVRRAFVFLARPRRGRLAAGIMAQQHLGDAGLVRGVHVGQEPHLAGDQRGQRDAIAIEDA